MGTLREHGGVGLVAVAYVALALVDGGFGSKTAAIATIGVWWVVIIGLIIRVWPGAEAPRAAIACGASLAGLGVITGLSLFWADDAGRAFSELVRVAGYLGLFVLAVLASRRGSAGAWAGGLAAGLGALAALSLLARFEPGLLTEGPGDLAAEIPSAAGRLSYPIGYWNGLGACMALAVVALGWMAFGARGRLSRAAAGGALALPVLAIYLSQSLGGAAAAGVGLIALGVAARERLPLVASALPGLVAGGVLVWLASRRTALVDGIPGAELNSQGDEMLALTVIACVAVGAARYALDGRIGRLREVRPQVPGWAVAGAVALVALAAVVAVDPVQRWEDFKDPGTLAEAPGEAPADGVVVASASGNGRYQWWASALDSWTNEPFTGVGAGNWELFWNANSTLPVFTQHAHSLFLETLAEIGPLGLLLLLAFFATAIVAGIGRRRSSRGEVAMWLALLAVGIVSAMGEWTWQLPAVTAPLIVAAAVLTGPATLRQRWPQSVPGGAQAGEADGRPTGFGLGVATLLAGFASIWVAGVSLLSGIQLDESRAAAAAGDFEEAATNARFAATIEPWSPEPRIELAGAEALRDRLDEARDSAEEAVDRAPGDFRTRVVLARVLARQGEQAAARAELAEAARLSPIPLQIELPPPD